MLQVFGVVLVVVVALVFTSWLRWHREDRAKNSPSGYMDLL